MTTVVAAVVLRAGETVEQIPLSERTTVATHRDRSTDLVGEGRVDTVVVVRGGLGRVGDIDDDRVERRRLFGLRAEILVLLVAEFVSLRFYEVLSEGVGDPTLANLFARIHADEQRHLEFHAATLPEHLDRWPSAIRSVAHAGWFTLVVGSAAVVAYDHRKVLKACGTSPLRFFRDVTTLLRAQHRRFFS